MTLPPDPAVYLNQHPDADEALVREYLVTRAAVGHERGLPTLDHAEFLAEGDLTSFRQLLAWWPTDHPRNLPPPGLGELCDRVVGNPVFPPVPFGDLLTRRWRECCAWLAENDRNLDDPNETREERRRRKGREAVARHRATSAHPAADELRRLHAEYIGACRRRQAAYDAVTPEVDAAKAAHAAAKAQINQTT